MPWHDDDSMIGDEVVGALLAIDATLAGEPADPEYAGLAELALILRAQRPAVDPEFARSLDERVARRFAPPAPVRGQTRLGRWWAPTAWGAGAVALAAAAAVVVVLTVAHGPGAPSGRFGAVAAASSAASSAPPAALPSAPSLASSSSSAAAGAPAPAHRSPSFGAASTNSRSGGPKAPSQALSLAALNAAAPASNGPPVPAPSPGRQIVQSSQLQLSTTPGQVDAVAQQVFDVVGNVDGIVDSSSITSGSGTGILPGPIVVPPVPGGGAYFKLRVPSANLSQALSELSRLRGANVVSRTDATQDITGQVGGAGERLAEARALRSSLLRQLAAATTAEQVASLKIQLRDADASIASDLSTLNGLRRQVAYSQIAVSIEVAAPVAHHAASGGGFTLGRGVHDAGRVLVVVAGVALIVLAALVPVALLAALAAWIGFALRRRRRGQALDAA